MWSEGKNAHARGDRTEDLQHAALLNVLIYVATAEYPDPLTFTEAMESALADEWKEACAYEIDSQRLPKMAPGH